MRTGALQRRLTLNETRCANACGTLLQRAEWLVAAVHIAEGTTDGLSVRLTAGRAKIE